HAGANLLLFVGGWLPAAGTNRVPRHQVYELAGRHNLDGLIVLSSTLSHEVGLQGVRAFCTQFSGLPLCSVGMPLPDAPSVTVDNETGMAEVVRHLIDQHRAQRIAFINGPAANAESEIRVGAYRAVLRQRNLAVEEQLILPGTFMMESGAAAVHALAKRFGSRLEQLDAIVAANDNMAIGAMDELGSLGVPVPDRIAVVGFDDIEEARLTETGLTTARQPLERLGREAVRRVLQTRAEGEELEQRISTELVVRQSCGCSALGLGTRSSPASKQRFQLALMGQRERILAQLGRAARGRFSAAGAGWEQAVLGALVEDILAGSSERFLPAAERLTQRLSAARVDLNAVDEVLSALREELVPLLNSEPEKHRLAEELFHAVRLSTSAALQRGLGRAHLELKRWARRIAAVCNSISAAPDSGELRNRMRQLLPELGLRSFFVCVYEQAGDASRARLMVSSEQLSAETANRVFRGRELLPPELATADGVGRSFAVLTIESHSAVLGHILFEYTAQHAFTCGAIAEAVGIAVRNFRQP
ncbi:MAG TPA: substrate-binding domain-containing protein, partial [Polyangiaceae bacterium]|nr:substrate-binding domain-containing protein [Polyangiaceae bacterium]